MENVLVAASNLYAVRALCVLPMHTCGWYLTSVAMSLSIAYHLCETRKHHMPGAVRVGIEGLLLNLDRLGAMALTGWFLTRAITNAQWLLLAYGSGALALNALSEVLRWFKVDQHAPIGLVRCWYIVWHSAWHVAAFHLVYLVAHTDLV